MDHNTGWMVCVNWVSYHLGFPSRILHCSKIKMLVVLMLWLDRVQCLVLFIIKISKIPFYDTVIPLD